MANATLTISVTGTVQGKAVSYSKEQDVDNIDTVIRRTGQPGKGQSVMTHNTTGSGSGTPIIDQEHDITLIANHDTRATMYVDFLSSAGTISMHLEPGCFFVVQKAEAGGNFNASTTDTTSTCVALTKNEIGKSQPGLAAPKYGVLGCFNYAS